MARAIDAEPSCGCTSGHSAEMIPTQQAELQQAELEQAELEQAELQQAELQQAELESKQGHLLTVATPFCLDPETV